MNAIPSDIADLLNAEAKRIDSPAFIADDPVQFPRRFSDLRDIEITSLLASIIAWGNRKMICRDAEKMLALMDQQPYRYMMERGYEDLDPDLNIHRTFFARHLQWLLAGLRRIYSAYPSLDAFAADTILPSDPAPAWTLVAEMRKIIEEEVAGITWPHVLPTNLSQSALKRINMALRWLVRDDGIVDLGVWKSITPDRLFIPLDVHVGNTARNLGLLQRKSNDRKSVELLTSLLRTLRPEDPVYYDFALFGIGIEHSKSLK